uniref:ORF9 n=1 Tax=Nitrosopumilaceae spindle-shaped virus TaxID=3065433 RepID=A0AAT9J9F4_9VIRU
MVKTAKEKELEKQIAEATAKQAGEVAQAEIEVYEGQNYEARQAYEEAIQKRAQTRSTLPEKIPDDPEYKERLLQSQYIEMKVVSPKQVQQVREYREEIKKQQQAKQTVQVLDKEIPQLYSKAVEESKEVKKKAEQARQAEIKKQEALITSYQQQITEEKQRVQREAQAREDAYQAYLKSNSGDKSISKKIHYGQVGGVELMKGDIILSAGRGYTNVRFHKSYYEKAVESYKARGYNVSVADLQKVSAIGKRTQSGKIRDSAMRAVLDPSGKSEEAYQQSRAQAKRNVASAYASMSAKEKVHSSAMASTYAINHDMSASEISQRKDAKFDAQMNLVSEMTGGLISPKKKGESQDDYYERMRVYESNELYKKTGGLIDIRKDVTSEAMKIIQKQREIELANRRQQEYVKELRAGNIGIATALTTPQTTQSYTGKSTGNLNTFLKERGLVAKTAPDSMFKPDYSEKLTEARQRASMPATSGTEMGDLRTQSPMFVGKTDQPYQMRKAGTTELRQRELAQERIDVFKPKVIQQQPVKDSIAFKFTNLKDPQVGTLDSGKPLEQKGVSSFGVTPSQSYLDKMYDYTVPSNQKSVFPLMSGQTFQATTPVTFGTQKEAEEYVKSKPKEKVFSGTDNEAWNRLMYAPAVYTGELPDPRETGDWVGTARLTGSTMLSPLVSVASSAVNLTQPEDKQIPIYRTGSDVLISGTIDDVIEGQPLRGTGVTGTYNYVKQDPLRAVLELPAEGLMWIAGGKAVSLGTQAVRRGVKVITPTVQSVERSATRTGYNIVQSTKIPNIIKAPVQATMVTGRAVKSTLTFPYNPLTRSRMKQAEAIGSKNYPPEVPRQIEKIGSTYVITPVTTESFPQTVSAITVKFGKGGKTAYYSDTPQMIRKSDELLVTGSKLDIEGLKSLGFKGSITSPISKEDKFLYKVPLTKDNLYAMSSEEVPKRISQVGTKTTEPTRQAKLVEQGGLIEARLRPDTQESILALGKMEKARKLPKEYDPQPEKSNILGTYKKTSTTQTKETMDLPPSKTGQTLDKPAPQSSSKGKKLKEFARAEAKADVKTSPYSSAIVGTATKASAVVGTKALASTRVDTGVKIQQEIKTGLVQETALKTQQQLKTPQRLKTGMRMETGLKLDTGSKLMTQQKTVLSFSSPIKTQSRTQRPKALPFVLPKVEETETRGKRKRGKKAGFIGNVRLDNIMGMYKRKEITYGQKKVTKLERQDMRLTAGTKNRIAFPSSGLLKTKKKKKSKSESMFGRKTKDEFAGFESKPKKKSKGKKKSKTTKVRLL